MYLTTLTDLDSVSRVCSLSGCEYVNMVWYGSISDSRQHPLAIEQTDMDSGTA